MNMSSTMLAPRAEGRRPVVGYVFTLNRRPGAQSPQSTPSNLFWGALELAEAGYQVEHFYPSSYVRGLLARSRFAAYFIFLVKARQELAECDVLYVSAHNVILAAALGKFLGVVKPELLVVQGAVHIGLPRGGWRRPFLRVLDRWALKKAAITLYLTAEEARLARRHAGLEDKKVGWIRFGVDAGFYQESAETKDNCIIAIGNDGNRDWPILSEIATRLPDVSFKVVTQDARIRRFSFPGNVEVCTGLDLARSKILLARARGLLLATKPNLHFSGMTTVMNAMLVGTPVVLDEAEALPDYFLRPGGNCLAFKRGDAGAAVACLRRLFDDAGLWRQLREEGLLMREAFGMKAFGATLARHVENIAAGKANRAPALEVTAQPEIST
ncbi:MAG TPA: hypothetical protein VK717_12895 [Opitutaceae bacterium]|jgi:glycosyltransferase involved in cell wall biosynthesis|nr:hypothetical protein [Opitutaceae bacterium]